jgi:hypothetical protein
MFGEKIQKGKKMEQRREHMFALTPKKKAARLLLLTATAGRCKRNWTARAQETFSRQPQSRR